MRSDEDLTCRPHRCAASGETVTMSVSRITIVGGGIGGLTLAAVLDPARFEVTLLEAEPGRRALGSGLGMWPAARAVLTRIGAWARLAHDLSDAPTTATLYDITGRPMISAPGPDLSVVARPALMEALTDAVPPSVRLVPGQVEDPTALAGDVVVGADGVRSRVRGIVHPRGAERIETPYVALRGVVDAVDPTRVGEYWGPGRLFGLAPMSGGRGYWFTTHRSSLGPEPLDLDAVVRQAREAFADAAPAATRILAAADSENCAATRMWVAPPMPRYVRGRYVVIGDAAHASLPNLGRGACDAILDAASLGRTLNAGGSPAAWQARRLPMTQAARLAAGGVMRLALSRRVQAPRDRVIRTIGRAR